MPPLPPGGSDTPDAPPTAFTQATESGSSQADESTVAGLAERTRKRPELVRKLYQQEVAALRTQAHVKNYIRVIAEKRVKRQLLKTENRP